MINKAYKFRLYPNQEQKILINKTFGCSRFIYNKLLEENIAIYEKFEDDKEELKKQKFPSYGKYKIEFPWLKEVDSQALSAARMNLMQSYTNFFRELRKGNICFPKFKSKKSGDFYTTFLVNNNIRIGNGKLRLPKLGLVKFKQHREIPVDHKIKSVTVSKTPSGKYFASILVEFHKEIKLAKPTFEKTLGLDYSSQFLFVDSDGSNAEYPRFFRLSEAKLAKAQRKLSKRKKDGRNYVKQKILVAKLYEKVSNQRKDFLHKISNSIAKNWDMVVVEDINMTDISRMLKLAKSTYDNGFGMLRQFLKYKLEWQGKSLIKIDKWFPSSRLCNVCGNKNTELQLSDRVWTCKCGAEHDRDLNAAINIRDEGWKIIQKP